MSQHDIKLEKMKLINLLNGEVTFKITEDNSGDVDDLTHLTDAESTWDETVPGSNTDNNNSSSSNSNLVAVGNDAVSAFAPVIIRMILVT